MDDLNIPDTRQAELTTRIEAGAVLVKAALAEEFGVSPDTIRRDLIALEERGLVRRIRGGAMPVARPMQPVHLRAGGKGPPPALAEAALGLIRDGMVLLMDGGTTVLSLARRLHGMPQALVITPAPAVALECIARGVPVRLLGGRVSPQGGVAVGHEAHEALEDIAADLAILGACAVDAEFGVSSDDAEESAVKRQMAGRAGQVVVMAEADKFEQRARHRTLAPDRIDCLITDAAPHAVAGLTTAGVMVIHV